VSIGSVLLSFPFPFHHPGSAGFPTLFKGKKAAAYRTLARSPHPASASSWHTPLELAIADHADLIVLAHDAALPA
jgi:hypothetical protein